MSGKRFPARFPGLAVLLAVTLIGGVVVTMTAAAADPDSATVTVDDHTIGWNGERFEDADNGGLGTGYGQASRCLPSPDVPGCDHFSLTVDVPENHWETNSGGAEITILPDASPADEPEAEQDNFDIYVYQRQAGVAEPVPVGQSTAPGEASDRVTVPNADGEYLVVVQARDVTDSAYQGGVRLESRPNEGGDVPPEPLSNQPCVDGKAAGIFPCKGYDLASFLPKEDFLTPSELNDIWGWTDPETGKEYAIVGQQDGTSFVDVTDAENPKYLGRLNTAQQVPSGVLSIWRDMKVYNNHAYIVSEEPAHGMQVFDLRQLRDADPANPEQFTEEVGKHYSFIGEGTVTNPAPGPLVFTGDNAHNLVINEESGFAYAVGTSTCNGGGLHMIDLGEPGGDAAAPEFAGCVTEEQSEETDTGESYVHDAQCVNYDGPDTEHQGDEICFNSSQDSLTIVKVADDGERLEEPDQLSRQPYDESAYTHQGWLTADGKHFLLDDELDETDNTAPDVANTQTYVFNVEDLDSTRLVNTHKGETTSIDHNQYTVGDRSYQANYRSGLRVLDVSNPMDLNEVGFFDVFPTDDAAEFNGAWSNYPYFKSGNIIVSGIEQGLFVLKPSAAAAGSGSGSSDSASAGTSTPAKRLGRLRAGFGNHSYGRVRNRAFPVQCRVRGTGTRRCLIRARYTARGKTHTIGSGRGVLRGARRSATVRVKLNHLGRRLLARKPRGIPVRLALSAREVSSPRRRATNSRKAKLRPIDKR